MKIRRRRNSIRRRSRSRRLSRPALRPPSGFAHSVRGVFPSWGSFIPIPRRAWLFLSRRDESPATAYSDVTFTSPALTVTYVGEFRSQFGDGSNEDSTK